MNMTSYTVVPAIAGRMMALTQENGLVIWLSVAHIVAVRPYEELGLHLEQCQSSILTSAGVEYHVQESIDDIGKRDVWR